MTAGADTAEHKGATGGGALDLLSKALKAPVKFIIGVLFCLHPLSAVLVLGWLLRLSEREAVRSWYRHSPLRSEYGRFSRFAALHPEFAVYRSWPNWFFRPGGLTAGPVSPGISGRLAGMFRPVLYSFWLNLKYGLFSLAAIAAATLPFSLLWLISWWAGWENSFNKGYEQAFAGPVLALIGIGVFLLVMYGYPTALARLAVTRRWRCFFEFRTNFALAAETKLAGPGLALLYVVAAIPYFLLKAMPVFIEEIYPDFASLSAAEITEFAEGLYLLGTLYVFSAIIALRRLGARLYARQVLAHAKNGGRLDDREEDLLGRLKLAAPPRDGNSAKAATRRRSWARRLATLIQFAVMAVIWFEIVAQLYVGQFLNHSWPGWVNHPLLQLPWLPL